MNELATPLKGIRIAGRSRYILGTRFQLCHHQDVLEAILGWRQLGEHRYIVLAPTYSVMEAERDRALAKAINSAALVLPDGVGITIAARLLGYAHCGRVSGPSLLPWLADRGRTHRLRHYFYGGAEGVARDLAAKLQSQFEGLEVAGTQCPPFDGVSSQEDEACVKRINACHPDIVWVALGTSKQEKWMADHVGRVNASAMVGVGAAFDFHSGRVPWAPVWVRSTGLEWAFRLLHEPRRLWRRNLDSPAFLLKVVAQRLRPRTLEKPR